MLRDRASVKSAVCPGICVLLENLACQTLLAFDANAVGTYLVGRSANVLVDLARSSQPSRACAAHAAQCRPCSMRNRHMYLLSLQLLHPSPIGHT